MMERTSDLHISEQRTLNELIHSKRMGGWKEAAQNAGAGCTDAGGERQGFHRLNPGFAITS